MAIVAVPGRIVGLVVGLQLKQRALGMGEGAFAAHMGVDRSWWYRLQHGKAEPSVAFVRRVMDLWPGEFDQYLPELYRSWGVLRDEAANGA